MSLWASAAVVPVRFLSHEPPEPVVAVPAPEVGRRWGRPSTFSVSASESRAPQPQPGFSISGDGDEYLEIVGYETGREYATVRVENPKNAAEHFDTEAIKAVTFYIGSRTTQRMQTVSSGDGWTVLQPIYETVDEHVRFEFPVSEGTGEGLRGQEDPTDTPDYAGVPPVLPGVA